MKYIFIFSLFYQPFQCIGRKDTVTSAVRNVKKDSLAVDKTHDKSHRLHAMHYNIDLVVITTSSVYCDHKKKQQQANRQTKHQTSEPKKQMKKKEKKKE